MSWNLKVVGKPEVVKKEVEANTSIPDSVKAVVLDNITFSKSTWNNGYDVEGYGHHNSGDGSADSNFKLEIKPIKISE